MPPKIEREEKEKMNFHFENENSDDVLLLEAKSRG